MPPRKRTAVQLFSTTPLAKELMHIALEFSSSLANVKSQYETRVREIAKKYRVPDDKIPGLLSVLLKPSFAEALGYSNQVSVYIQGLEERARYAELRLDKINERISKILQ